MLYRFLADNREKILALTRQKTVELLGELPATPQSERGLPGFFKRLAAELEREAAHPSHARAGKLHDTAAAEHGRELSKLGYTVAEVVHSYGVLCQAITELAAAKKAAISAGEFGTLNHSLDVAIAEALAGYTERRRSENGAYHERIGFLVHELRNALSPALIAHSMLKKGVVGSGGSTNALLQRNLTRMSDLLDRSFVEARKQKEQIVDLQVVNAADIVAEVAAAAEPEARRKGLRLAAEESPLLQVLVDVPYLVSALSNLTQNAIKYSRRGGTVRLRAREKRHEIALEVEDACGGLPAGKAEELFEPFVQKDMDRTGLGLGLTISREAVAIVGGRLSARDLPGKGCVFTISLPEYKRGGRHAQRISRR